MTSSRRSFLHVIGGGLPLIAGCTAGDPADAMSSTVGTTTQTSTTKTQPRDSLPNPLSWSYGIGSDIQFGATVIDGSVYVPSADLYALTADGAERWIFETDGAVESKPIAEDALYFTHSATIQALEFDGTARWQLPWKYRGAPYLLTTTESDVYASGVEGVGAEAGYRLVNVDAETGQVRWTAEIGSRSEAVVRNGTVFVASPNYVRAFATSDGSRLWEARYEGIQAEVAGIFDGTLVVYGDDVYGLSTTDGTIKWTFGDDGDFDERRDDDLGIVTARMREGQVFVATERGFRVLSTADGRTRWRTKRFDEIANIGALGQRRVLLVLSTATAPDVLVSVRIDDGAVEWSWSDDLGIQEVFRYDSGILVRGDTILRSLDLAGRTQWQFDFGIAVNSPTVTESGIYVGTRAMGETGEGALTVPGTMYGIEK